MVSGLFPAPETSSRKWSMCHH